MIRHSISLLAALLCSCASEANPGPERVAPADAAVASIVVLEQRVSCACTKTRQDDSRAAFEAEMAERTAPLPVDTVYVDVNPAKARTYRDLQEPIVMPAYYFLDENGILLTFLQGEITADQFSAALGPEGTP